MAQGRLSFWFVQKVLKKNNIHFGEQGIAQHSPPTNVARLQILCRRHVWVEFVLGSLLCSERFSFAYCGFPLSSKTNVSKFQFDLELGRRGTTLWMCYLQILIIININIIIIIIRT